MGLTGPSAAANHHDKSNSGLCIRMRSVFSVMRPQWHSFQKDTCVLKSSMEVQVATSYAWVERIFDNLNVFPVSRVICALIGDRDVAGTGTQAPKALCAASKYRCVALHVPQTIR